MTDYRTFWDVPVADVPQKTGAATVMDCSDIADVLHHLNLNIADLSVIDVGCGTGRVAQLCARYVGYDIAPGMVEYAKAAGHDAHLLHHVDDLTGKADLVTCLSVFTHISREDRCVYLNKFAQLASHVLVDILPGVEGGYPGVWFADTEQFLADIAAAGWTVAGSYPRVSPDLAGHLYFWLYR